MTITTTKDFEPSKDLALLPLINRIKKLGFTYRTSDSGYSTGASVSKPYGYGSREMDDVFIVNYHAGIGYRRDTGEEGAKLESEALGKIAIALMDSGLAVEGNPEQHGLLGYLRVFAYDNAAELEAWETAQAAQAREEAKVTPQEKAERIKEARKHITKETREAQATLTKLTALVMGEFGAVQAALNDNDAERAFTHAKALEEFSGHRYTADASFDALTWAMRSVKGAQEQLAHAEALELKDEVTA